MDIITLPVCVFLLIKMQMENNFTSIQGMHIGYILCGTTIGAPSIVGIGEDEGAQRTAQLAA